MGKRNHLFVFLFLSICILPSVLSANSPVVLQEDKQQYLLGLHLDILEDTDKKWTITEITSPEISSKFVPSRQEKPNFGFTDSAYWVRFHLKNEAEARMKWLLLFSYAHMDHISLYRPTPSGKHTQKKAGDLLPFSHKEIKHRYFLFNLPITKNRTHTYFLRIESKGPVQVPLYVLSQEAFLQQDRKEQIVLGLYFGLITALILYNLFLFFSIKEWSYLLYVISMAVIATAQMSYNGLAFEYVWPHSPWWTNRSVQFFMCASSFGAVWFTLSFLPTKKNTPKLHGILLFLMGISLLGMVLAVFADYSVSMPLAMLLVVVFGIVLTVAGIVFQRKGYRPVRYYLIAWSMYSCGIVLIVFRTVGILPNVFFTEYGVQIGSVLAVILLSLALADQINILGMEKKQIQASARKDLQSKVREKTTELNEKYDELEAAVDQIVKSIQYGEMIQRSLLPDQNSVAAHLKDHFVIWEPKDIVGGDIYLFEFFEDGFLVGIVDCSGHGVPGAFMTMIASSSLKTILKNCPHDNPAGLLGELNIVVAASLSRNGETSLSSDGMDAGICFVNTSKRTLTFAGARIPLVYIANGQLYVVKGNRQGIGYEDSALGFRFKNHEIPIKANTSVYLATNSIAGRTNDDGGFSFGRDRLLTLLEQNHLKTFGEQKEIILDTLREYEKKETRNDDITVIGFGFDKF